LTPYHFWSILSAQLDGELAEDSMKPFRKNVALAVDGGGIRGTIVARALAVVEESLGYPISKVVQLTAGTSTGSVIAAGIAMRLPAARLHELYVDMAPAIFHRSLRFYSPFARYRFSNQPMVDAMRAVCGERTMSDFWIGPRPRDVVITVRDLLDNRTRFVKSWKPDYRDWKVWYTVLCSCSVPVLFPPVDGRFVDGGFGCYVNPCYLAAYEAAYCLGWDLKETTLISLGTGRGPAGLMPHEVQRFHLWDWISPALDTFMSDASDQQVRLVQQFFPGLDFRRFQVDLESNIDSTDPSKLPILTELGDIMGQMILADEVDPRVERQAGRPTSGRR
jgi:predicted acylesterase/phospholipase RssA